MLVAELPAAVSALPLFGGGRTPLALVKTPASHLLAVAPSMSLAVLKYRDQKQRRGGRELFQLTVPGSSPSLWERPGRNLEPGCHILVKNEGNECTCVALLSSWGLAQ